MADPLPHTTTAGLATATPSDDFDRRWAAWQARGAVHELRVRRRMMAAIPIVLIGVVLVLWFLAR